MLASEMDVQIGLASTVGNDGLVEWVYPYPFASAPLVFGTPRDPVIAGINVAGNDRVGALVVIQLATHLKVRAQVFLVTDGAITNQVKVAPAGVGVNFVALWPVV